MAIGFLSFFLCGVAWGGEVYLLPKIAVQLALPPQIWYHTPMRLHFSRVPEFTFAFYKWDRGEYVLRIGRLKINVWVGVRV